MRPSPHATSIGLGVFVMLLVVALLDYVTQFRVEFFVFYAVPVALATWFLGARTAVLVSLLAASMWYLLDQKLVPPDTHWMFSVWCAAMKFVAYLSMVLGTSWLKRLLHQEQAASRQLAEALAEVRELKGLLPICAWCKKVRDDQGYWSGIETYISSHTRASFTHSICPTCRGDLRDEMTADGMGGVTPPDLR